MRIKRNYDRDFKLNAVKLYQEGRKSQEAIAEDLGIPKSTFAHWIKEVHIEGEGRVFPGEGKIKASHEEVFYLKRALAEVKQERDILKKAVAIFSQNSPKKSGI